MTVAEAEGPRHLGLDRGGRQAAADAIWREARAITHRIVACGAFASSIAGHSVPCERATREIAGAILKHYRPPP